MKKLITLSFFVFAYLFASAQKSNISGVVTDDLNFYPLTNAAITLVSSIDSSLTSYTRADVKGRFLMKNIKTGQYDIYISYPDYLGYAGEVKVGNEDNNIQLDTVFMIKNSRLLDEVTIVDGSKIKFKGDTIQFIADSFKVGANATVEDLLKKLSGLQVNAKGEITAFGEKVEKVFVDGEEFFGDDPTIATKNIQAKAIDKVQVFDKTSQMEELTGISDGEKFKAINLTLKDEYKKGYFGKAKAGIGLDPLYYDESLMLQGYTGKSKFSVYGIASNTGTTGLNFDDLNKYMGSQSNVNMSDDGGVSIYFSGDEDFDWGGRYNGEGLPTSLAGGASYSTKLSKDKIRINANYGYSDLRLKKSSSENSTNFLEEDGFVSSERETLNNKVITNSGKFSLEMDIDSFTTLSLKSSASKKEINSFKRVLSSQVGLDSVGITDIDRDVTNSGIRTSFNNDLSLIKKFKKKRRLLVINGTLALSDEDAETKLLSENNFYSIGEFQILDQKLNKLISNKNLNARATYTEPIAEKWVTQVNYYYGLIRNLSDRVTNEFDENTQSYSRYIDTLSNDFDYKVNTNGGGLAFAFKNEKLNYRFGTNVDYANISRVNKLDSSGVYNNAFRWLPSANINYKFTRTSNLRFSYNGYTKQPSIDQVQPVRDNSNPLRLIKGNPDLIQSYTQNFNLSYNTWKALSEMGIWSYAGFNNTFNNIVENTVVDESRRSITTYTNVNGGYSGYMGGNFNKRLTKTLGMFVGLRGNLNNSISYINGVETKVLNTSIQPTFGLSVDKEEKFDINVEYSPSFNNSKGGLVAGAGKYFGQNISSYARINITKKIELTSHIEWSIQSAQNAFSDRFSQVLWNANVQWTIDKGKNFVLELAVNDILNQNRGYNRSVNSFRTMERRYDTIRRYGFLSLIYNIKSKI